MQDGRIEGLSDPTSELDAARKKYVDDRDEVKTAEMRIFALTEDQKLTQKIAEGDKFKSIQTKNMLNLKSGDFSTGAAQFNVYIFGEYRDFTQKYHNSKAHIVCSLQDTMGLISVDIGVLKPGKYGLRVEGIIDPKDDGSRFDHRKPILHVCLIGKETAALVFGGELRNGLLFEIAAGFIHRENRLHRRFSFEI